jgi:hypothetical protein
VAQKERSADLALQRLDLAADGGLGQCQFVGGGAKVQMLGNGQKGAQRANRNGAGAQVAVKVLHAVAPGSLNPRPAAFLRG